MADGKRGRRPDSKELRSAKARLRAAETDDAKSAAEADIEEIRARERETRIGPAGRVYSDEDKLQLLIKHEPLIREAEDRLRDERKLLAAAFGSAALARKKLEQFRRAQTIEGETEAREVIAMHERVAARRHEDASAPAAAS